MRRVNFSIPLFVALCILLSAGIASAVVHLEGVRYWSSKNYTRVVIDLDGRPSYTYRLLRRDPSIGKPPRLYVDIRGATLNNGIKKVVPIDDGLLMRARVGQYRKDTVRVVLDIKSLSSYKVFHLFNPHRIVIDVRGEGRKSGKEAIRAHRAGKPHRGLVIVIDPGHGGKDPGAIGKRGLKEKDVTLKVSKLLKWELRKRLKASKIVLTRDRDVYIPLDERTAIANSRDADIFVSVHVNASYRRTAQGVETYYLGSTQDEDALRVAARENATTTSETTEVLQYIIKDLERSGNQQESIRLASLVQEGLSGRLKKRYRDVKSNGIKGALFYVLLNCDMPSVLVEVSFITNPQDEKRLRSPAYLREIARGIADGIIRYLNGEKT